jgi:hypothetical protein
MKKDEWWLEPLDGTAADVNKELAINLFKWLGWKVLLVLALIVVL